MKRIIIYAIVLMAIGYISCKKAYRPQLTNVSTNFLAVDGPIISGDSTFIRLSRSTSLTDTTQNKAELKAAVAVESDQNTLYPLTEKGKGLYVLGVTNFDATRKYRLNIKTSNGKIYQSDFVPMKVTPAIDSIYIKQTQKNEIAFYADAHDNTNNTRYYRWDYKETWAYVPIYHVNWQYKNGVISYVVKGSPDDVSVCYRTANSNLIIIGSTTKLTQDILKEQKLFSVTDASEKIAHVYTIQMRQYALTKEGYEYYQNLKTNTEQLGSIFDAQASATKGNIHCVTNAAETVLGFISASTVANRQFDLLEKDNPLNPPAVNLHLDGVTPYSYPYPGYDECVASVIPGDPYGQGRPWTISSASTFDFSSLPPSFFVRANKAWGSGDSLLYDIMFLRSSNSYLYAPKGCIDCRLRGGTNIRPSYFPGIR